MNLSYASHTLRINYTFSNQHFSSRIWCLEKSDNITHRVVIIMRLMINSINDIGTLKTYPTSHKEYYETIRFLFCIGEVITYV